MSLLELLGRVSLILTVLGGLSLLLGLWVIEIHSAEN